MFDHSVKYTIQANLMEKGRVFTPPLSATVSAEDSLDAYEFHSIAAPPAGTDDSPPTTRTLDTTKKADFEVVDLDKVFFLAFVPGDPAPAKTIPIAVALETFAAPAPAFGTVPLVSTAATPVPLKPEEIVKKTRDVITTTAAATLLFDISDGGLVFAGPAARLLEKALGATKFTFTFWNLSTTPIGINIIIGRRK